MINVCFFKNSNNIHNIYYNINLRYLLRSKLSDLFAYDLDFSTLCRRECKSYNCAYQQILCEDVCVQTLLVTRALLFRTNCFP